MPNLTIQRLGHACGARVTGVDLSKPVSAADLEAIRQAWLENLVLVFPGQKLDPRSLVAFTRNFGELDDYATQPFNRHPEFNEVFVLTNKRTNGKPSPTYNSGQNWHTDLSYTLRPAKGTAVYCVEKPSVGGDTMFANMYLAYERLSPKMREFLDGLEAVHDASLIEGLDKRGPEVANEFRRLNPPVVHPAVRLHAESGRKALYVNERVRNFLGLSEAESKPIVKFLCEHSVQPRHTYRHYWTIGDLVMWDNRCLVHLAVGDYDPAEIRHMIRTSCMGDYYGRYLDPEAAAAQMKERAGARRRQEVGGGATRLGDAVVPAKAGTPLAVIPAKAGTPFHRNYDSPESTHAHTKRVARPVKQPVVYILASEPYGTLYIGVTSSLAGRIEAHRNGCVDGFTKQYACPYARVLRSPRGHVRGDSKGEKAQEVEPRMEDQADRGDESRLERSFCAGFLTANGVPAFAGMTAKKRGPRLRGDDRQT